jgi:hypothetical protein
VRLCSDPVWQLCVRACAVEGVRVWTHMRRSTKCRSGARVRHDAASQGRVRSLWPWRGHGATAAAW